MTGPLCPRCRCPVAKRGVCDECWRELGGVVTAPYPLCEHPGCKNEAIAENFRCMEHAAPEVRHECCAQAKANLRLMPSRSGRDAWRLHVPVADDSRLAALVSVTYCPWCGVELEEWRRLQRRPKLEVVRDDE